MFIQNTHCDWRHPALGSVNTQVTKQGSQQHFFWKDYRGTLFFDNESRSLKVLSCGMSPFSVTFPLKSNLYCHSILFHLLFQIKFLCHRQQKWPTSTALCPVRWGKADITRNPATLSYYFFSSYSDFSIAAAIFTPGYVPVCVTVCVCDCVLPPPHWTVQSCQLLCVQM